MLAAARMPALALTLAFLAGCELSTFGLGEGSSTTNAGTSSATGEATTASAATSAPTSSSGSSTDALTSSTTASPLDAAVLQIGFSQVKQFDFSWSPVAGATHSLSADGNTLAVGARYEDSAATVVNGNSADNSAKDAGAVYIFSRSASTWSQQAYVKAHNSGEGDRGPG